MPVPNLVYYNSPVSENVKLQFYLWLLLTALIANVQCAVNVWWSLFPDWLSSSLNHTMDVRLLYFLWYCHVFCLKHPKSFEGCNRPLTTVNQRGHVFMLLLSYLHASLNTPPSPNLKLLDLTVFLLLRCNVHKLQVLIPAKLHSDAWRKTSSNFQTLCVPDDSYRIHLTCKQAWTSMFFSFNIIDIKADENWFLQPKCELM